MRLSRSKQLKILDFDIENRPLSYLGSDFTTSDVTGIAASFVGEKKVYAWILGQCDTLEMLGSFRELVDKADILTGHYIRKHDLPILNGAFMEFHLRKFDPILTSDTKMDLYKYKGISAAQESLAGMYGLPHAKHHMSQHEWRIANRLTKEGIKQTRKRVVDDVIQHKALREKLIEDHNLAPPSEWDPGNS
jgi:hypothetical protein